MEIKIEDVLIKLRTKYLSQVTKIEISRKIGAGKMIKIFYVEITNEIISKITKDAKPFGIAFIDQNYYND